jgi:hypothetical protein
MGEFTLREVSKEEWDWLETMRKARNNVSSVWARAVGEVRREILKKYLKKKGLTDTSREARTIKDFLKSKEYREEFDWRLKMRLDEASLVKHTLKAGVGQGEETQGLGY